MKRGEVVAILEAMILELQAVIFGLKVGSQSGQEVGQESGLTTPIEVESFLESKEKKESKKEESKKEESKKLYRACLPTPSSPTINLSDRGPRGTRLPTDWEVGPAFLEYASRKGLSEPDARHEAEKFKAYWLGVSGKQAIKLDWLQVWQVWILNALDRYGIKPSGPSGGQEVMRDDIPTFKKSGMSWADYTAKYSKRAE